MSGIRHGQSDREGPRASVGRPQPGSGWAGKGQDEQDEEDHRNERVEQARVESRHPRSRGRGHVSTVGVRVDARIGFEE